MQKVANGVYEIKLGKIDNLTPSNFIGSAIKSGKKDCKCIFDDNDIIFSASNNSALVELPLFDNEDIYGLGLMLKGVRHTKTAKRLKVNSDPSANTGDSHAPAPFYVSTRGYGILVDTAQNITISMGNTSKLIHRAKDTVCNNVITNVEDLYAVKQGLSSKIIIEIPNAQGVKIIIFCGDSMIDAVARYNLYCGGGAMPPMWGLSTLYRCYGGANSDDVINIANIIRKDDMPIDVIGLEPGWQTHSYSCSLKVNDVNFPDFAKFINELKSENFHINLWEHAFLHSSCPLYEKLFKYAGNFEVWEGLVPDFTIQDCKKLYIDYHEKTLMDIGVDGFKIDECDDADYSSNWSFPGYSKFPSGLNGEQMHSIFGVLLQKMFDDSFKKRNTRYFSQVRSSFSFASNLCFALYSDLYSHKDFIRGVVNCGFSGLLWSPEVRQCNTEDELYRRLELASVSPQSCINAWMIPSPPWEQFDIDKNINGVKAENCKQITTKCRQILNERIRLLPYLYNLFYLYATCGEPTHRAVALNYPNDFKARAIDDQFMLGNNIMVAPFIADDIKPRKVYLPQGAWYDYYTNERIVGNVEIDVSVQSRMPMYVLEGTLLPVATKCSVSNNKFEVELISYGKETSCNLFEDDGVSFNFEQGDYNLINIVVTNGKYNMTKKGNYQGDNYKITKLTIV